MDIPQIKSRDGAAIGEMGQQYLATGKQVALRRWEEGVGDTSEGRSEERCRDYETVGYVLSGILELDLDGQTAKLEAGDSWLVPANANHAYRIIQPIIAIEATSPPARFGDKDQRV